jgi:methionyl-tRNA synthetase
MDKNFYLTTTLPYVNAEPHIGTAFEFVTADIIARYRRLSGDSVFFNTGVDEHGQKVYTKALEEKKNSQDYANEYAEKFRSLKDTLNLSYDNFIRTTDEHHKKSAQEFWRQSFANGDIYKKLYKTKYCVSCELERTDSELVEGCCPEHPGKELEIIEEENYFFKFSKYQKPLLELYKKNPQLVIPDFRFNEIIKFVERGLEDFSISRLKSKMPWGVEVPDDNEHVMFVWFDALVNYISAIGWPDDMEKFNKWWPVTQFAGKDQVRQQVAMWQAMLMSVGLPPSKQIIIHGFITIDGAKMSKSIGNVINPKDIVNEYGADALRYYLARHINPFEDSDFTMEKFKEAYNANLANGIGNLTARIMKLAEIYLDKPVELPENLKRMTSLACKVVPQGGVKRQRNDGRGTTLERVIEERFRDLLDNFEINKAVDLIWEHIGELDKYIQEEKPFAIIKEDKEKGIEIIKNMTIKLYSIAEMLSPILPQTSEKIKTAVKNNKMPEPLFARK